jgi:MFS family permease
MAEAITANPKSDEDPGASFGAVLGNRNFLFLWMAQLISQLAQQMINYALVVQVAKLSNASSTATAGIVICFTIPAILFSAIAGVFVDRTSKKRTLVVTNAARGVAVLLFVGTTLVANLDVFWGLAILYANTLLFSAISQFFAPAEAAMIPLLVSRNKLIAANSLFNLTLTASQLIGFVLLGTLLVPLLGLRVLYILLCGCYIVCALLCWRLPDIEAERGLLAAADDDLAEADTLGEKARLAWDEFKEGWGFIRGDSALMIAILYWSISISVFMMLAVSGPKFLKDVLQVDPEHLYFILIPGGLGLVLGVILVGRFATEGNRATMINYGLLFAGIGLLVLALIHDALRLGAQLIGQPAPPTLVSQVVIGAAGFFLGACNSFISVPSQTVLQERAPDDIRARVFAAFYTVSNTILIVPLVIAGAMADLIGVLPTVVGVAALVLVIAIVGLRYQHTHPHSMSGTPAPPAAGAEPEAIMPGTQAVEPRTPTGPKANGAQARAARPDTDGAGPPFPDPISEHEKSPHP